MRSRVERLELQNQHLAEELEEMRFGVFFWCMCVILYVSFCVCDYVIMCVCVFSFLTFFREVFHGFWMLNRVRTNHCMIFWGGLAAPCARRYFRFNVFSIRTYARHSCVYSFVGQFCTARELQRDAPCQPCVGVKCCACCAEPTFLVVLAGHISMVGYVNLAARRAKLWSMMALRLPGFGMCERLGSS